MLAFMKWNMTMLSNRKHLIFMVLFNVLLINCGYVVQARPNASATLLYDSDDKTNVRKKQRELFILMKFLLIILCLHCCVRVKKGLWYREIVKGR